MSTAKSLVERAAQQALQQKEAQPEQQFSPEGVPTPLYWQIIVEPIKPKAMVGSLYVSLESQQVEELQINVGKIMAMGRLALEGKTPSGLDMSVEKDRLVVGAFVQWFRYTGQRIKVIQDSGEDRVFMAISSSDLMCIPADPYKIRFWI